jgi:hypothetical protein
VTPVGAVHVVVLAKVSTTISCAPTTAGAARVLKILVVDAKL